MKSLKLVVFVYLLSTMASTVAEEKHEQQNISRTAAQSPYSVRIMDNGNTAEIINSKDSTVARKVARTDNSASTAWVSGSVSNDGAIVALQNSFGRWMEIYDFSTNANGNPRVLRPQGDPKFSVITRSDTQQPTVMIHNRKVVALGSAGLYKYGLMVWDLDHLVPQNHGYRFNKMVELKRTDTVELVDDKHAYVHTMGWFKPYVYQVAIDQ